MDPIEVQDWTRGELLTLQRKIRDSRERSDYFILLSEWEMSLLEASLEIAGDL